MIVAGAVYSPVLLIVPRLGFKLQVTAAFPAPPVTVAVNSCVCPADSEAAAGFTVSETGAEIEIVPVFPRIGITVPSAAAANTFVSGRSMIPEAVGDKVRDRAATVPSGIVFAFKPEIKQR